MRKLALSGIFALGLAGCGSSPPSITLGELAGEYRATGCHAVEIRGSTMLVGDQRIELKLIRIKLEDTILAAQHPRVASDKACGFVIVKEPIYLPVRQRNGVTTIEIPTDDWKALVAFRKVAGTPSDGS